MSLKISNPGKWESPRKWRLRNGLDSPEWDIYANLFSKWGFRVALLFLIIGMIIGYFVGRV